MTHDPIITEAMRAQRARKALHCCVERDVAPMAQLLKAVGL